MSKWKIFKIVLAGVTALLSAAKSVVAFIDQIGRLRRKPATSTA